MSTAVALALDLCPVLVLRHELSDDDWRRLGVYTIYFTYGPTYVGSSNYVHRRFMEHAHGAFKNVAVIRVRIQGVSPAAGKAGFSARIKSVTNLDGGSGNKIGG